jgi:PhzF family phenazine biosynthesis protein
MPEREDDGDRDQERQTVRQIKARMFYGVNLEDAASGSAGCALSGWLARGGLGKIFKISQGKELGRESEFSVGIGVDGPNVETVWMEGTAVEVMNGYIRL